MAAEVAAIVVAGVAVATVAEVAVIAAAMVAEIAVVAAAMVAEAAVVVEVAAAMAVEAAATVAEAADMVVAHNIAVRCMAHYKMLVAGMARYLDIFRKDHIGCAPDCLHTRNK